MATLRWGTHVEGQRPSQVFAGRLRETRKARGLTQTELAQRMTDAGRPMSKAALLRIENGTRGISLDEALALIAILWAVPPHLLTPPDGELVCLTDEIGVDGGGLRGWLRYGHTFATSSGDLPDELVTDRVLETIAIHAVAFVDAMRGKDKAGQLEALRAIDETVADDRARKAGRTDA